MTNYGIHDTTPPPWGTCECVCVCSGHRAQRQIHFNQFSWNEYTYFRQWKPIQFPCNLRRRIARCATCKIMYERLGDVGIWFENLILSNLLLHSMWCSVNGHSCTVYTHSIQLSLDDHDGMSTVCVPPTDDIEIWNNNKLREVWKWISNHEVLGSHGEILIFCVVINVCPIKQNVHRTPRTSIHWNIFGGVV